MKRIKLGYEELTLVINSVVDREFTIRSEILGIDLLKVDYLHGKIIDIADKKRFEFACTHLDPYMKRILPSYLGFRDALQVAGLLPPPNLQNVLASIKEKLEEHYRDRLLHPREPVLALDSNVLYLAFCRNYLKDLSPSPSLLASDVVRDEISRNCNKTADPKEISSLRRYFQQRLSKPLIYVYGKMKNYVGRRAYVALQELDHLPRAFRVYNAPGSGSGDRALISSYVRFQQEHNVDAILLTFDRRIQAIAHPYGLSSILVEQSENITSALYDHIKLPWLLYALAVYFMSIRVEGEKAWIRLLGEWRGKSTEEWINGILWVEIEKKVVNQVLATHNRLLRLRELCRT